MTSLTRGPLPASVYWRRRLVLLTVGLLLVVGLAKILGGSSDGSSSDDAAASVAADTSRTSSPTGTEASESASASAQPGRRRKGAAATAPAPAPTPTPPAPVGSCDDSDVLVTPSVTGAAATQPVAIMLTLRTSTAEACTWELGPESFQLKITSGKDRIYTTVQCPRMIRPASLVVRRDFDTVHQLTWHTRRSDDECTPHTQWAQPGWYHVTVAALGGEPAVAQFELATPAPPAPAPTPAPTPTPTDPAAGPATTPATTPRTNSSTTPPA
jgi:hypothetical protein